MNALTVKLYLMILGVAGLLGNAPTAKGGTGASSGIPALRNQGTATQLVVDGQPFIIPGGA